MKVPEPRKLKSGTWFIQLRLGGESIPVSALSKAECIKKAQLIKAEHRAGKRSYTPAAEKTPRQLMDAYIEHIRQSASPSTLVGYNTIRNNRFRCVSDTPCAKILDWQSAIDADAKLFSPKTIKNSWAFLSTAMRFASLPVPTVRLPQIVPADRAWLDPDEILKFVELLRGQPCEIPALLALHSLRRSEILALTFGDIDLDAQTISVRGAAVVDEHHNLVYRPENKNVSSRRVIPIMIPALLDAILAISERPPASRIYTGNANTPYRQINRICAANNLPLVGVHGLRHSFASLAYHLGLSELETMELGGWSDSNTMRKIYTHLARADRIKATNKIAEFFHQNAN